MATVSHGRAQGQRHTTEPPPTVGPSAEPAGPRHHASYVGRQGAAPAPAERDASARDWRWFTREAIRRVSQSKRIDSEGVERRGRVPTCGLYRQDGAEAVEVVRNGSGLASYRGVQTCGSVWACPVCAAKIRQDRSAELDLALTRHVAGEYWTPDGGHATRIRWRNGRAEARGGGLEFVTMTLRHRRSHSLLALVDACADGWRHIQRERWWRHLRAALPFGFVRALEVTVSWRNGWHAHLHVVLLTEGRWSEQNRRQARAEFLATWTEWALDKLGMVPRGRYAVCWENATDPSKLGKYLMKNQDASPEVAGLAAELARGDAKRASAGSLHPFDLAVIGAEGNARARALWVEYEETMRGRRALTWSQSKDADGLTIRDRLTPDWERLSDEDVAAAAEQAEHVTYVGDTDWSALRWTGLAHALLRAVENGEDGHRVLTLARERAAADENWHPPGYWQPGGA